MCCLPCQSFILRVEVPGPKSFFSYRSVRCYIYLISCVADPDPLHLACFYMFGIEYMYITYLHSSINHKVVSCLFQRWGEKNHNRKKRFSDPDPLWTPTRINISKGGSEDLDPLFRKGGSEDPDPDPVFQNVDPGIRIRNHDKMRWIRNSAYISFTGSVLHKTFSQISN